MSWFRGGRADKEGGAAAPPPPAPAPPPPVLPPPVPGQCLSRGCAAQEVYVCAYVDGHGMPCGATLCPQHIGWVYPGGAFCRRHYWVAYQLSNTAGSLLEHDRPSTRDRGYDLLEIIVAELSERMYALLQQRYYGLAGVGVTVDVSVRRTRRGAEMGWEKGWSVYTQAGNLLRVALRVDGDEPPHVHAFVNRHPAFDAVPDWIVRRPAPGEERQVREEFVQRILMAVHAAISSGTPT